MRLFSTASRPDRAAPEGLATPDAARQLASLTMAVLLLSPGQRLAGANPAAEQFLGQSYRRVAGRLLEELITFDEPRLIERLADIDAPLTARDAGAVIAGIGPRRLDLTVAPVAESPGWQLVTLQDASAAEALGEDNRRADDTVLRAPDILAHDIKNPLAGIRGAAQLLARRQTHAAPGKRAVRLPVTVLAAAEAAAVPGVDGKAIQQLCTLGYGCAGACICRV